MRPGRIAPSTPISRVIIPQATYRAPGCCIYCGCDGDPTLDLEHIIPDALGGRLRFENASCRECATKTSAVERLVIRRLFGQSRFSMGMRRGHRRKWDKDFDVYIRTGARDRDTMVQHNGAWVGQQISKERYDRVSVPRNEYHGGFVGYNLRPAKMLLKGAAPAEADATVDVRTMNIYGPHDFPDRLKRLGREVLIDGGGPPGLHFDDLGRFLAKIAHSAAVAELGIGSFVPFLTRAIRNERPMNLANYIGGLPMWEPADPTRLYSLEVGLWADRDCPTWSSHASAFLNAMPILRMT